MIMVDYIGSKKIEKDAESDEKNTSQETTEEDTLTEGQ